MKKLRSTTPVLKRLATSSTLVTAAVLMTFSSGMTAYADRFDTKINAIQGEINGYQQKTAKLGKKADTLDSAIGKLQAQQNTIQGLIDLSQAKYDKLQQQIKDTEVKVTKNQKVLSQTIGDLYVSNDVTPIELLASSHNIGDYLDQQEFRSSVRDNISTSIQEIKKLKQALQTKQKETKALLDDQTSQKQTLLQKKSEQSQLLSQTKGNEASYQSLIGNKTSQISQLKAQQSAQEAVNAAHAARYGLTIQASSGSGGYPSVWGNAPQDSIADQWGMYNRECVSYTAWRVDQAYGNMPYWGGRGNANQWPGNADGAGIPRGSKPKVGSVAVYYDSVAGHAAWVESVQGNTVTVSQYNYFQSQIGSGHYSTMTVPANFFDTYIYFGDK